MKPITMVARLKTEGKTVTFGAGVTIPTDRTEVPDESGVELNADSDSNGDLTFHMLDNVAGSLDETHAPTAVHLFFALARHLGYLPDIKPRPEDEEAYRRMG